MGEIRKFLVVLAAISCSNANLKAEETAKLHDAVDFSSLK